MNRKYKLIISANIRKKRRELDLTQKELGEKIGVPYQYIQKWEGGQEPNWKNIEKLSKALGVPVEQLTTDSSEPSASSPVQDVHIKKVVREELVEDSRMKLIIQYLEKILGLLEPPATGEKEKLIDGGRPAPSSERKMGQD